MKHFGLDLALLEDFQNNLFNTVVFQIKKVFFKELLIWKNCTHSMVAF